MGPRTEVRARTSRALGMLEGIGLGDARREMPCETAGGE
jgi:hypothetical protein